ncbi:MAG: hypothetical protein RLZZ592_1678 [Pseudomonadota bacterium]|jgi:hypothetical protein
MADSKDSPKSGFFRKVVQFALNPTTDWSDLNGATTDSRHDEYARSELKAMIERKRRNDFVRKREFDALRRIRREGLSGDRLANLEGLEGLSNLDETDARGPENHGTRPDSDDVIDKIAEIERQMVGDGLPSKRSQAAPPAPPPPARPKPLRPETHYDTTTAPQVMSTNPHLSDAFKPTAPMQMDAYLRMRKQASPAPAPAHVPAPPPRQGRISVHGLIDEDSQAVVVSELAHDPDLDEAVIAFANADFELCERSLLALVSLSGPRAHHIETWRVLFDHYRATGNQTKFDSAALDYQQRFGMSPPQWFSIPKMVHDAAASSARQGVAGAGAPARHDGHIGWVCPEQIDVDAISLMGSQILPMPLPWVLDWRGLRRIDPQAAGMLNRLLHEWSDEPIEMRWIGADRLFAVLAEMAPNGMRDADPAFWLLRMEALRLAQRTNEFDQAAIDYCMTYEVSPPSWMPARCLIRLSDASGSPVVESPATGIADVATGFMESQSPDMRALEITQVELNGQLLGDIGALLRAMDEQIGTSAVIHVSCARLMRVDFIAAGELLNWVISHHAEGRQVTFVEAHRLVALFCGAMGITEQARVTVRKG